MVQIEQQYPREDCYICGFGGQHLLERHHVVPRRHGGSNDDENLVHLCPTCHRAVEKLYNHRFYRELGVVSEEETVETPTGFEPDRAGASEDETGDDDEVDEIVTKSTREWAKDRIWELQDEHDDLPGVPMPVLVDELSKASDLNIEDPEELVHEIRHRGEAYSPDGEHVRLV